MNNFRRILGVSLILNVVLGAVLMSRDTVPMNVKGKKSVEQMVSIVPKTGSAGSKRGVAKARFTYDSTGNKHVLVPWQYARKSLGGLCDSDFGVNDSCAFALDLGSEQVNELDQRISRFIKEVQQLELDTVEVGAEERASYLLVRDNAIQREKMWASLTEQVIEIVGVEKAPYVMELLENDKELALMVGAVEVAITMSGNKPKLQRIIMSEDKGREETVDAIDEKLSRRYGHLLDFGLWEKWLKKEER